MRRRLQKLLGSEAAEIAEAAVVMPVVFIFLLGIIWFGRAFNIYSTITQAAQQGALVAARPACATCPAPASGCTWNGTDFPCNGSTTLPGTVVFAVAAVMQASSLDPSQIIAGTGITSPSCTTSNNISICREVRLDLALGSTPQPCTAPQELQICGTMVSFQYPFQFYLPFTSLNLSRVVMSAQAQSRMEN